MTKPIIAAFSEFSKQGDSIGRMVVGYGEIEFEWAICLAAVLGDLNQAIRTLYRLRSEANRFEVGDALMRQEFTNQKLGKAYLQGFEAVNMCKKIRNQYAHCHWTATKDGLYFTTFDKAAETRGEKMMLQFSFVDSALLSKQENYFLYCLEVLRYLRHEMELKKGAGQENIFPRPKVLPAPPLHNPKEKSPHFRLD